MRIDVRSLGITAGFLLILIVLAASDALVTGKANMYPANMGQDANTGNGVAPAPNPDVFGILTAEQLTMQDTREESMIARIVPTGSPVVTRVILMNNDRVGLLSYTESTDVKSYFLALKQSLQSSFSPSLTDLQDITDAPDDKPVRNILTFQDPALNPEKMLFLRVRERLYEFHIADGKDAKVNQLVEALSQ